MEIINKEYMTSEQMSVVPDNAPNPTEVFRGEGGWVVKKPKSGEPEPSITFNLNPKNDDKKTLVREITIDGTVNDVKVEVRLSNEKNFRTIVPESKKGSAIIVPFVQADELKITPLTTIEPDDENYSLTLIVKVCHREYQSTRILKS